VTPGNRHGAPTVPRRMKPLAILVVLPVVLAACAGEIHQGSATSGIQGRATIGPQCPVEMAGSPCPDAPFAASIAIRQVNGDPVLQTETGDDGRFHIPLPPGTYTIEAEPLQQGGIARMLPMDPVTVRSGVYTTVAISFDSGIR
jgi:hypothetical protein